MSHAKHQYQHGGERAQCEFGDLSLRVHTVNSLLLMRMTYGPPAREC